MEDKVTERVLCYGRDRDNSALETAALLNGGLGGGQWNNPMMYLVWMWVMRYMNGNYDGSRYGDVAENFNSRAISQLQSTVDNNHNNDIAIEAIKGNAASIRELASTLNTDFNTVSQALCGLRGAIDQVGGKIGFSAERVINAVTLGDQNITSKLAECCCQTQQSILRMGYDNQLATERQTGILGSKIDHNHADDMLHDANNRAALMSRIDQLANGVTQGFASIGYEQAKNTQAIINNASQNTQRILDQMCANQTQALRDIIAQKDRELQSQSIINQLRNNNCNC